MYFCSIITFLLCVNNCFIFVYSQHSISNNQISAEGAYALASSISKNSRSEVSILKYFYAIILLL